MRKPVGRDANQANGIAEPRPLVELMDDADRERLFALPTFPERGAE